MAFDTKYRPLLFSDVIGQEGTVTILQKLLQAGEVFHKSYVFAGPSGTGKTTTARILARAMLCDDVTPEGEPCNTCESCLEVINGTSSFSFVEMDAANNSNVDTIRSIVDSIDYFTLGGKERRIYLIDECFTEDTELMTEDGLCSIRGIVESRYEGKVLSYDPETDSTVWKSVIDWFDIPDERETLRLTFDNGVELTVTIDQELYTTNRGWVKACELNEDDHISETKFEQSPNQIGFSLLVKKESGGKRKVYDITVEDTHSFFAASRHGKQVHSVLSKNCHRLSKEAMDALLKPMEDNIPGSKDKRLVCLFCTTEPEKLRSTIKARCMMFGIKNPKKEDVVERLEFICKEENINYDPTALEIIFSYGQGHIRDMVSALERVSRLGDITPDNVREQLGLGAVSNYYKILELVRDDLPQALSVAQETLGIVDASTLYEGLANAALASYRVSKGLFEGIGYVDQERAQTVYDSYADDVLWIADRILGSYKKIDANVLVSEIVLLHRYLNDGIIFNSVSVQREETSPTPVRAKKESSNTNKSSDSESDDQTSADSSTEDTGGTNTKRIDPDPDVEDRKKRWEKEASQLNPFSKHFVNKDKADQIEAESKDDLEDIINPTSKADVCHQSEQDISSLYRSYFDDENG